MVTETEPLAFARPPGGQPSPGLAHGEGHFYSDGFRPGDFKMCYGVLEELLKLNPGWLLADGTVTLQDGTQPPNLCDRFIVGAGAFYALGDTGGSSELTPHTHEFTQPEDHEVTQPDDHEVTQPDDHSFTQPTAHADHALTNNHTGGSVLAHSAHAYNVQEFTATGLAASAGTGRWAIIGLPAAATSVNLSHDNNHTFSPPTPHSGTNHDNNHIGGAVNPHAGTAVDAHAGTNVSAHAGGEVGDISPGAGVQLPPYAALYFLVKVY